MNEHLQRRTSFPERCAGAALAFALATGLVSTEAGAQELVHRFNDPSFGGNPFNSGHLLGIANLDRPAQPTAPSTAPTEEDLVASQLRARLLSTLSSDILTAIQSAKPGQTGEYNFGNQRITYAAAGTGTTVTFFNTATNETKQIIIPTSAESALLASPGF